jgi:hypothetical protein
MSSPSCPEPRAQAHGRAARVVRFREQVRQAPIYRHAWKRTWNGCNAPAWTHWNQYHNTFTVLRRDLCPDICRDIGDEQVAVG